MNIFLVPFLLFPAQAYDVSGDGCVDLKDYAMLQRGWTGPDCSNEYESLIEMVLVPGGGSGPSYDFVIGKFEVTNKQYAMFLNDAQLDGGMTPRGSFFWVENNGMVTISSAVGFVPGGVQLGAISTARIYYHPLGPLGGRFFVHTGYENHPVTWVSWIGAVKFCNWLTIASGMTVDDLCYRETVDPGRWAPMTKTVVWPTRDLNDEERLELVQNCRGYRLPMDNLGESTGAIGLQDNAFNEWYKAMAYDPNGPTTLRFGVTGEPLPLRHWLFAFGRDTITPNDANYANGSPFVVGFFNGVNWLPGMVGLTNPNNNAFNVFDGSGNVIEHMQDLLHSPYGGDLRAVRGGAFGGDPTGAATTQRGAIYLGDTWSGYGFRVVRVP